MQWQRVASELRRDTPVFRVEAEGFAPFWAITRHADVMSVSQQNDLFLNTIGSVLVSTEVTEHNRSRFLPGLVCERRAHACADAAQPLDVAFVRRFDQRASSTFWTRAFRRHHDAELRAPFVARPAVVTQYKLRDIHIVGAEWRA